MVASYLLVVQTIDFIFVPAWNPVVIDIHGKFYRVVAKLFGNIGNIIPFGDP